MNLIEKIIEEKINRYGIWLLSILSVFASFFVSYLRFLFNKWTQFSFDIPTVFEGIILAMFWIFLMLFFLTTWEFIKEKILYPFYSIFKNKIISTPRISKWIFQGSLKIIGDFLEITASNSGCLIKDYFYRNFVMKFNLKIFNGGRTGIIFRAQDLENYMMLELALEDGFTFSDGHKGTRIYEIVPWVRFLGNWELFNITPEPYHQTELEYGENGLSINLRVENLSAFLAIESNNKVEEFRWDMPTHTESNIPLLSKGVPIAITHRKDFQPPVDGKFIPKIWFRNKYGKVGFRAHAWQIIRISDLKIEKI